MKKPPVLIVLLLVPALLLAQSKAMIDANKLNQAILAKNTNELTKLIKNGGDVNYQYNGRNALHVACDKGYTDMAILIIEAGADVNAISEEGSGRTALQFAAGDPMQDFPELVELLLKSGADPNLALNSDQKPLFEAIKRAHAESVRVLLEHGASTSDKNSRGQTPLDHVNYLIDRGVADPVWKTNMQKIKTLLTN